MSITMDTILEDIREIDVPVVVAREDQDSFQRLADEVFLPDRDWFEAYAKEVFRSITRNSGVGVDWSRVDLASKSVPISLFPFERGTVLEALEAYMQWSGLFIVETRDGTLAALNPNTYESGRTVNRMVVFQPGGVENSALAKDDDGWFPILVGDVNKADDEAVSIDFPLAHTDESLLERSMRFCLELENGDVLDLETSTIAGSPWGGTHVQLWRTEFRANGPMHPDGESAVKVVTVYPTDVVSSMLGHQPWLGHQRPIL